MKHAERYFYERSGCPFCGVQRTAVLCRTLYHNTAEANHALPNIEGTLYHCAVCGIAYSSHGCSLTAFSEFYQKSFRDLSFLNQSVMQKLRRYYLQRILKNFHNPWSFSRFLNRVSLNILQVPSVVRQAKGLRILDVGCGFGEFLCAYKALGNQVVGTEVIPELVQYIREQNIECHLGAVEEIPLHDKKFDVIILRAVFYRTQHPVRTLQHVKSLLAPHGEIVLVDPCPTLSGVSYFFQKQFPQGHFYITDPARYLAMLYESFGFVCRSTQQIYGRPAAALKTIRTWQNITGAIELLTANILRIKPYVLSYNISAKTENELSLQDVVCL